VSENQAMAPEIQFGGGVVRLFAGVCVFLVAAGSALASPILCTDSSLTSMASYRALGTFNAVSNPNAGCQLGDKIFSGFTYAYSPTATGAPDVPDTAVLVTFNNVPFAPTITFSTANGFAWFAPAFAITDVNIGYQADVVGGPPITSVNATVTGIVKGPGDNTDSLISASERVSELAPVVESNPTFGPFLQPPPSGISQTKGETQTLKTPSTTVTVNKDLLLLGGTDANAANDVTLISVSQTLQEAPEPLTLLLFGSGLVCIGLAGRAFKQHRSFGPRAKNAEEGRNG